MDKPAAVTFPAHRLAQIAEREQAHFWHAPRSQLLMRTIAEAKLAPGTIILDVGCGTGALVRRLREAGLDARGLDPWATNHSSEHVRLGQAEALPYADASLSALCAFDVIEHADDDAALAEMWRVLQPGAHLFLSVPAHPWLWSKRDELARHRRRYTRRSLARCVAGAGFRVERIWGYQFLLLPAFALARLVSRDREGRALATEDQPSALLNRLLLAINGFEVSVGRFLPPPTGSSLLLVARKPGTRDA
jgi:SAM-dependent methyltransferase